MTTMTSEREAFEKWAKYKWFDLHRNKDNESYTDPQTHRMWESWQARAHLSQPAQAVDVTEEVIGRARDALFGSQDYDMGNGGYIGDDAIRAMLATAFPNANGKEG